MSTPIYEDIARELLTTGEVSPVTYYMFSRDTMSYDQCGKRLKPAIAHLGRGFRSCGTEIPNTVRDGRLIYKAPPIPPSISIDFVEAEKSASEGLKSLAAGDMEHAVALSDHAIETCEESYTAQRLRHHVALRQADSKPRDILRAARDTTLRRESVRHQIERLNEIAPPQGWSVHRETVGGMLDRLHEEYEDLLLLALRTEALTWPQLREEAEDRAVGELCALSLLAQRLSERHAVTFRNAIAEHPTTRQLAAEIAKKVLAMADPCAPIQPQPKDVFRVVRAEVCRSITEDIQGDAFSSLRELRKYIRRRCGVKAFLLCMADQYALEPELVALVYRKWTFEKKYRETDGDPPSEDIIRAELGLSRRRHEDKYWKMLATEDMLSEKRASLTAISVNWESGCEEGEVHTSPDVADACTDTEDISVRMVRSILRKGGREFQENLEHWMIAKGGLDTSIPCPDEVASELTIPLEEAEAFVALLAELVAISGPTRLAPNS